MAGHLRAEIPLQYADNGVNPGPGSGSHPMFHDFLCRETLCCRRPQTLAKDYRVKCAKTGLIRTHKEAIWTIES
jgi:hypothetical protein